MPETIKQDYRFCQYHNPALAHNNGPCDCLTKCNGTKWNTLVSLPYRRWQFGWDRIFALYLVVAPAVPSSIHPAPNCCRWFPNGTFSPRQPPMLDAQRWNARQSAIDTRCWNAQRSTLPTLQPCKLVTVPSPCPSFRYLTLDTRHLTLNAADTATLRTELPNSSPFHHLTHPLDNQCLNTSPTLVPSRCHEWIWIWWVVLSVNVCHPWQADHIHSQRSQPPTCSKLRSTRSATTNWVDDLAPAEHMCVSSSSLPVV
jgi:hypothetical protein